MAFFDDLGKKITQAGQTTIQKTKEMADVARMNSYISDEEKKINNFYLEIGKRYVSLHTEDFEGDYADMINGIRESEEKIKSYQKELEELKGVKKCPKCGAEVKNDALFCSICGEKMPQEEPEIIVDAQVIEDKEATEETKKFCGNCGKEVNADAAFCPECGTKL